MRRDAMYQAIGDLLAEGLRACIHGAIVSLKVDQIGRLLRKPRIGPPDFHAYVEGFLGQHRYLCSIPPVSRCRWGW
jgi:hypothetical protein